MRKFLQFFFQASQAPWVRRWLATLDESRARKASRATPWIAVAFLLTGLGLIGVLCWRFSMFASAYTQASAAALAQGATMQSPVVEVLAFSMVFCVFLFGALRGAMAVGEIGDALAPLSRDPVQCLAALECVSQSSQAKAWRDVALAAGRQLRGFDLIKMQALRDEELGGAACKALHGVVV